MFTHSWWVHSNTNTTILSYSVSIHSVGWYDLSQRSPQENMISFNKIHNIESDKLSTSYLIGTTINSLLDLYPLCLRASTLSYFFVIRVLIVFSPWVKFSCMDIISLDSTNNQLFWKQLISIICTNRCSLKQKFLFIKEFITIIVLNLE